MPIKERILPRLRSWRRPPHAGSLDLRWDVIGAEEVEQHPGLVDDLLARSIDGLTVEGVFAPSEITQALDGLRDTADMRTPSPIGSVLGMTLGDIGGDSTDRTPYLDDGDRCRALYRAAFGFDPHQRIAEVLAPMLHAGRLIPTPERGREYNPGHVRWFDPGHGGLRAHVGNEFRELLERGSMNHLVQTTRVSEHLSYFAVLQRPERGGSLSVYDLRVDTYRHQEAWHGSRDDSYFDTLDAMTVDARPGSLVVFGGGWRWHRIEPVHGSRPRVTYGGFCAPAVTGPDIHFWT